ncbi:hypothetical protein BD310DRAFT_683735 [Dichomitus squalens]|uniref:Uncharacterized protein n=1 Tax=Dichomitus squalens TaxID=114155 RepID=A0A4Q9PMQ0_9APHY|nr:hypothetical protein BD310DRAFT_683735 [Dichomitus squalens]
MLLRSSSFAFAACVSRSGFISANHRRVLADCVILCAVSSARSTRAAPLRVRHEHVMDIPLNLSCCMIPHMRASTLNRRRPGFHTPPAFNHLRQLLCRYQCTPLDFLIPHLPRRQSPLHSQSQTHVRNVYSFIRGYRNAAY